MNTDSEILEISEDVNRKIMLGIIIESPFLATIFSFYLVKLIQHIHRTSWYFRNGSQLNMYQQALKVGYLSIPNVLFGFGRAGN